jgi:hypothetical protein
MTTIKSMALAASSFAISLFALAGTAAAQSSAPHAWRTADPAAQDSPAFSSGEAGPQAQGEQQQQQVPPPPPGGQPQPNDNFGAPPRLTLPQGTYVTVRINQWLSSDRSQQGDTFFATLAEPVVVDGIVVAQRGQNVSGRVTEAMKAGMAKGVSHLGIELTELTLVDGQQVSIRSQVANRQGPTSVGRDVGAVAGTTALGAAVGAIAGRGTGAAIGAGAGAAAGIIGVLLTRGQPTVVAPETLMTFRIEAPVTIATDRAPQAFRYVEPPDYQRGPGPGQRPPAYAAAPGYGYAAPAPYPYAPYAYPYYGYGFGPGFGVYVGPGFGYYRGYGYRGGFYRR